MIRAFSLTAALAVLMAGPALATGTCSTAPATQFKPKATLEAQLKSQGLKVRQIKVENGCYEVYAVDKSGKKVHIMTEDQAGDKSDDAYKVAPWFVSTRGYGFHLDASTESWFDMRVNCCCEWRGGGGHEISLPRSPARR